MMAKLHFFDVDIARKYGVNAALIFQNLVFWIKKNEEKGNNFHNGTYWTYNSREQYHKQFPYLKISQINSAFKKLIDNELIITGNFNKNSYDQTLWYALTDLGLSKATTSLIDSSETTIGLGENDDMLTANNNTYNSTNCLTNNARQPLGSSSDTVRKSYGEFNNIKLSDEEYDKLVNEFGKKLTVKYIDSVDRYIASKGAKYKNHYATIMDWISRAIDEGRISVKASKEIEELEEYVNSIDYSKLAT